MLNALLWNVPLTAGLAIVLTALCRLPSIHKRPALRHLLWLLLLAKLITPPLIGVPLLPAVARSDDAAAIASPPGVPTGHRESASHQRTEANSTVDDTTSAFVDEGVGRDVGGVTARELRSGTRVPYLGGLFAVSLIGTCVLLTVHGVRAAKLYRWLKRAGTEDSLLAESCALVASSLQIRGVVRSRVVNARTAPLLWAWRRPLVVVPRQLVDDLSPQQLRSIVAHELAHYLRRDHWTNVFAFAVKVLLWWNPVVWWAGRELRAAQELCCDAIAIDRCGANRRGYATTLLKALDFIQAEPLAPRELVPGMGSRASILRRFEMIGETKLSYRLSRWTLLVLMVLGIPLVCIPVRAQEKTPAAPATSAPSDPGTAVAADAGGKKAETAKAEPTQTGDVADSESIDPKTKERGEAVRERITTYSDEKTLTLKDGQTGRMKIKKNVTPVAEILITPHFAAEGTKFHLESVDAKGKAIEGAQVTSRAIHDAKAMRMGLGKQFSVKGDNIFAKIQLTPTRQGEDSVAVEVKVLFTRMPTPEELVAMLLTRGKDGQLQLNFQAISLWIVQHEQRMGNYPEDLEDLNKPLPKDVYSPTGEDYHYEARRSRFILSSCGKDGVYGNDDDEIFISYRGGATSGQRHELYPLEEDEEANAQTEMLVGERPRGNCSISGVVISAETGKPVENARMYLFDNKTFGAIFINTAADGTFKFKDIPTGPFSMQSSHTAGYQDAFYNPDGKPGYQFVPFSLEDGEQRSGILLKVKRAYQISGKIVDENGKIPENTEALGVSAWVERDDGEGYRIEQAIVNRANGSYSIDGLGDKPVYVMVKDWRAAKKTDPYPPIYYPSTFSRNDAKQITFGEKRLVDNVNITLRKEGGLVLEGTVTDRETNAPIPKTLITVHHVDMLFDRVTAYTDEKGAYRVRGLGPGKLAVHVDASPWGYVRTRKLVTLDDEEKTKSMDVTVRAGVPIHGKFVDQHGKDLDIYKNAYGLAFTEGYPTPETSSWGGVANRYAPTDVFDRLRVTFNPDEGDYEEEYMTFPTKGTFVIPAMTPGKKKLRFHPKSEGLTVTKIQQGGKDIFQTGIELIAGKEVKDVVIMIGPSQEKADAEAP